MSGTLEDMHKAMVALIGVHETNGNNHNKVTEWYGFDGSWCDMGISYAAYHSGCEDSVCLGQKQASTVQHAQAFQNHGLWHPMNNGIVNSGIKAGDIVFFDWSGSTNIMAIDHVGYVESVNGSVVHTIECNVSNKCGRFSRTVETIAGFGRPKYKAPKTTSAAKAKPAPKYEPYPGTTFFKQGRKSPIVLAMRKRLIAEGCNKYQSNKDQDVIGSGDVNSYETWQRKIGLHGPDATWPPGKYSWDKLEVPNV